MPLKKTLKFGHVFCIATGAMISSGLFVLPGLAYAAAGPSVAVAYLISALLAMTGMLSIAELSTAMPKAGGDYFFTTRTMGPAIGTVSGILTWLSISLKTAFALVGMSAFTHYLFPGADMRLAGSAIALFFVLLNCRSAKEAGQLQSLLVVGLLLLMVFYLVIGFPSVEITRMTPFAPHGTVSVFATAGMVFVAFGGILKSASVAEEVQDPGNTLPKALIMSLLVVSVFYALMVFVTIGILPAEELSGSLMPISEGARKLYGRPGFMVMSTAAILAFVSTANAGIMAASRYLLAMSRDRLLPEHFSRLSARNMPEYAIYLTGAVIIAALFVDLGLLVKAASAVLISTYILANLALIILRESRIQNYRPAFHAPLYPWLPISGVIGCGLLLFELGRTVLLVEAGLIACGLFIFWFYGRIKNERDYALLHLIQRLTAKEIGTGNLEDELKTIIRERDEIITDRFDHLVEDCPVLDLPEKMTLADFFKTVAAQLSGSLEMDETEIMEGLVLRETDSNTAISPHIAIPHVILEGENKFNVLLVRCKEGIHFSEEAPSVHAVFVLAGTKDGRNFHLRCLASIAQIVQDPNFIRNWLRAKNESSLRDLVLLGRRKR